MTRANEILRQAATTYEERNALYKDNYYNIGTIMSVHFPEGVTISSPDDWNRIYLFLTGIAKQTRYTANWSKGGHQDSIRDQVVYGAMLEEVDANIAEAHSIEQRAMEDYTRASEGERKELGHEEEETEQNDETEEVDTSAIAAMKRMTGK